MKIGIVTGGGDCPGLNAVIRAVAKTAAKRGWETLGILGGFDGLLPPQNYRLLDYKALDGLLVRGGTILGTANRGQFSAKTGHGETRQLPKELIDATKRGMAELGLSALVSVGGDGSLTIAQQMHEAGIPIVGVPKTIDNDVGGTEVTFGFDTALMIATEALDRLHTTAEAHHRVMVLELMGRDAGFIALHSGVAGGADVILIPEIPFRYEAIFRKVRERAEGGAKFSLMAVSEGAKPVGGQEVFSRSGDAVYVPRLGGIGQEVGKYIESQGLEARVTVLGHLQRGGSPTAFDRWLATRYGAAAVRTAAQGGFGRMVALRDAKVIDIPISEALAVPKRVNLKGDAITTARGIGISFGDE